MREVQLTQGQVALVDDGDFDKVIKEGKWFAHKNGNTFYAERNMGKHGFQKPLKMHNFIMNTPSGMMVDHVNHNGLDNRRINLRIVTASQNQMNRNKLNNNKSGFKGVSWCKTQKKWAAHIRINKKHYSKYGFDTAIEASRWYQEMEKTAW